jgi:DNA modification methylase
MTDAFTLHHGDCLDVLRDMPDASVDAVVTDPPYGLSFMGKRWDYDVPSVAVWSECLRVLKPGGHLLSFGGSRTYHRMAVNVEDAGFEIRDQVMWVYGSGFPKSHNVSKAIDKAAGAAREKVGYGQNFGVSKAADGKTAFGDYAGTWDITAPATPAAQQWDGWGSALKPAHEPIVLARKPLGEKTLAANVLKHGTGGLNIDGCRVATSDSLGGGMVSKGRPKASEGWDRPWMHDSEVTEAKKIESAEKVKHAETLGRWPSNLIHDGASSVVEHFPGTGEKSVARFFYCAKAGKSDRDEGLDAFAEQERAFFQTGNGTSGKPSSIGHYVTQRNTHPTVKPTDLMAYLCRLVTPPGGVVLDPFAGSGSTGKAAVREGFKFIGIEREAEYIAIAHARIEAANV